MRLNCSIFIGVPMCMQCGNCSQQHTRTIDDAIDETDLLPM
jgi:hypothetical protein